MAINFAGGTDRVQYGTGASPLPVIGCLAFRMKTTQTTANAGVLAIWSVTSRQGFGFILNNSANKLLAVGYPSNTPEGISLVSTSSLNDGNWHHVAFNYNRNNGGANALFIDGASEATGNSTRDWSGATLPDLVLGDMLDAFWPSYVGNAAEVGHWNTQLDAAEIAALGKDFSPPLIRPASLIFYAPLVRAIRDIRAGLAGTATGTAVSDHCRKIGPGF